MSSNKEIMINYVNVQQQSGGSDCGLFAIAFATCLCESRNPSIVRFCQKQMRSHLMSCFEIGQISSFPENGLRVPNKSTISTESLPILYCVCHLPDDGSLMIQCSKCQEWFHTKCIYMQLSEPCIKRKSFHWTCSACWLMIMLCFGFSVRYWTMYCRVAQVKYQYHKFSISIVLHQLSIGLFTCK